MTSILDYIKYLPQIIALTSKVQAEVNTGISLKSVTNIVTDPQVLNIFEQLGASLFPKLAPELHAVAGLVSAYSPDYTKWVQGSLNALIVPSPNLTVDGQYGPKTKAAVLALQAQLGVKVDGWVGDITSAAIQAALAKLK